MDNEVIENETNIEQQEAGEDSGEFFSDALLAEFDSITESDGREDDGVGAKQAGPVAEEGGEKPELHSLQEPALDDEDAALIEGLSSERSKERVRNIIASRQEAEAKVQEFDQWREHVGKMFAEANTDANAVVEFMEFNRLATSNNLEEVRLAHKKIKEVEQGLAKRLGEQTDGYDPLSEFPDLKTRIEAYAMDEEVAKEIARERKERQALEAQLRQFQGVQSQQAQLQQQELQQQQLIQGEVNRFNNEALKFFQSKANEPGFQERVDYIKAKFADPAFKDSFHRDAYGNFAGLGVSLVRLQDLYNYAPVEKSKAPQPIRSKSTSVGNRSRDGMEINQRLESILDEMGI